MNTSQTDSVPSLGEQSGAHIIHTKNGNRIDLRLEERIPLPNATKYPWYQEWRLKLSRIFRQ